MVVSMSTSDEPVRGSPAETSDDTPWRSRRALWLSLAGFAVAAIVVVLVVFQPQKLVLDVEVDEALPGLVRPADAVEGGGTSASTARPGGTGVTEGTASVDAMDGADSTDDASMDDGGSPPTSAMAEVPTAPVVVAQGGFTSIGHPTRGTALLVRQVDGTHLVRIEGLETDNGPDLYLAVSTAAAGSADYSGLTRVDVLKGNVGNHNYMLPASIDTATLQSVVIWCERFSVAFGDAPLVRA